MRKCEKISKCGNCYCLIFNYCASASENLWHLLFVVETFLLLFRCTENKNVCSLNFISLESFFREQKLVRALWMKYEISVGWKMIFRRNKNHENTKELYLEFSGILVKISAVKFSFFEMSDLIRSRIFHGMSQKFQITN